MTIYVKDERTVQLVRRYAKLHSTTYAGAVKKAVAEALKLEGHAADDIASSEPRGR